MALTTQPPDKYFATTFADGHLLRRMNAIAGVD
jgi:hypothetical protein